MCFVDVVSHWHQPDGSFFLHQIPLSYLVPWAEEEPSGKEPGHHPDDVFQATDQPIRLCSCNSPVASHTPQTLQALHFPGHWLRITEHSTSSPVCNSGPSWIVSHLTLNSSPWPVSGDVFWSSDEWSLKPGPVPALQTLIGKADRKIKLFTKRTITQWVKLSGATHTRVSRLKYLSRFCYQWVHSLVNNCPWWWSWVIQGEFSLVEGSIAVAARLTMLTMAPLCWRNGLLKIISGDQ